MNGTPLIIGGGNVTTAELIAANIKKGVNVKVGNTAHPGKYVDIIGTFEGYVPEVGDIYKNGVWGDGWSAANAGHYGHYSNYDFPPSFSYENLYINAVAGHSSGGGNQNLDGFTEFNKQMVFPTGSAFSAEIYNPNNQVRTVYLFMTPSLASSGNNCYLHGTLNDQFLINGTDILTDGYSVVQSFTVNALETKTISIQNSTEFAGYVGLFASGVSGTNVHIKKLSLS